MKTWWTQGLKRHNQENSGKEKTHLTFKIVLCFNIFFHHHKKNPLNHAPVPYIHLKTPTHPLRWSDTHRSLHRLVFPLVGVIHRSYSQPKPHNHIQTYDLQIQTPTCYKRTRQQPDQNIFLKCSTNRYDKREGCSTVTQACPS